MPGHVYQRVIITLEHAYIDQSEDLALSPEICQTLNKCHLVSLARPVTQGLINFTERRVNTNQALSGRQFAKKFLTSFSFFAFGDLH